MSGEIPAELGSLSNLEGLHLDYNDLSGEIPAELGSLSNLGTLRLNSNDLSGEIPAELGSLSNLEGLRLDYNDLSQASLRINESLDFATVLQGVLDSACSLTGARYGVIALVG